MKFKGVGKEILKVPDRIKLTKFCFGLGIPAGEKGVADDPHFQVTLNLFQAIGCRVNGRRSIETQLFFDVTAVNAETS